MLGTEKTEAGRLFVGTNFTVVKKAGEAGEVIGEHNHPDKSIVFTVIKGKVSVVLGGSEKHELVPGAVLQFDGETSIQPTFVETGEFVVVLIDK